MCVFDSEVHVTCGYHRGGNIIVNQAQSCRKTLMCFSLLVFFFWPVTRGGNIIVEQVSLNISVRTDTDQNDLIFYIPPKGKSLCFTRIIYQIDYELNRCMNYCHYSTKKNGPSIDPPMVDCYGVATISRLLKIIGLFYKRAL